MAMHCAAGNLNFRKLVALVSVVVAPRVAHAWQNKNEDLSSSISGANEPPLIAGAVRFDEPSCRSMLALPDFSATSWQQLCATPLRVNMSVCGGGDQEVKGTIIGTTNVCYVRNEKAASRMIVKNFDLLVGPEKPKTSKSKGPHKCEQVKTTDLKKQLCVHFRQRTLLNSA